MEANNKMAEIVNVYSDMIYKIAFNYLKSSEDAEDMVQEVLITYINNKTKFKDKEHEKCWIIRVTINKCINHIKKNKKARFIELKEYSAIYIHEEEPMYLYEEINKLKEKYRVVFELFYFHDLKISEISKILGISEDNVKTRLKRAREKLRNSLGKEFSK
jgi:RNA polymerase sigma-70 factor (ECF subfamily)